MKKIPSTKRETAAAFLKKVPCVKQLESQDVLRCLMTFRTLYRNAKVKWTVHFCLSLGFAWSFIIHEYESLQKYPVQISPALLLLLCSSWCVICQELCPIIKAPIQVWLGPEFKDLCEKSCLKDLKNDLYSSRPVAAEHCSSSSLKMYVSTLERDACRSVGVVFIPCCQWWVKWKTWSQIKESGDRLKKAQNDVVSHAVWQYRSTQLTQFIHSTGWLLSPVTPAFKMNN